MFPESVSEILVSTKMETKNGWIHLPDIGKAQPDLYSRQFCCGGWWVSWHISNGAKLMESQKSGKIGSFFKVWSSAFRRVSSQIFAGSQNLLITLPWSFRNFSDLGSNVPQLSKLFFHLKVWRSLWLGQWRFGSQSCQEWIFTSNLNHVDSTEVWVISTLLPSMLPLLPSQGEIENRLHETQITSLDGSMIHRP